ncbi:hypothetical protein ACFLW9_01750 [Chloroflexota bacterium]
MKWGTLLKIILIIIWKITYTYIIPLGLAIFLGFYLIMSFPNLPEELKPTYILSIIAVLLAGVSVTVASRSLELTRNTQRPFLTIVNEPDEPTLRTHHPENPLKQGKPRVTLHIKNTGTLPADKVSIICSFHTEQSKELPKKLKHSKSDANPPIYFPGIIVDHTFYLDTEDIEQCKKTRFNISVDIKYDNEILRKTCATHRSFIFEALTDKIQTPISSTHRKDYWY